MQLFTINPEGDNAQLNIREICPECSENNNLLQSKDTNEEFLNFFSKNENKEDNIQENLDNQGDEDTIGLTLQLKKFKFSTGMILNQPKMKNLNK